MPTSLQMGWIESPPYFCAASASKTTVVASQYSELPIGAYANHPFLHHTKTPKEYVSLPPMALAGELKYQMEVFMDDYIALAIQLRSSTSTMLQTR